jgi:thioredoxin reductase (NADPH)
MQHVFDLLIIGGGPTGINCGIAAREAGLSYLILEKGVLVNSLYNFPVNMTFFSTSKLLEIGQTPFISHSDKPTRREALEYYRRLVDKYQLQVHYYEEVLSLQAHETGHYCIQTSKDRYYTHSVVIATGFYDTPRYLNVPGEDLPKVKHYFDDPHPYVGQKVLVIGARNSACDVALETYYKGAEVTMAIRSAALHDKVKYWILPNIENRIKEGSIKAYFNTQVLEIRPQEVLLQGPEGVFTIENDFVLAMTGYQPNYPFLQKIGIAIEPEGDCLPVHDPDTLETNLPNVYLAGVVCAGARINKLFIENTRDHGELIARRVAAQKEKLLG